MAGKAVSYQFLDALAKSVGMNAETVKQALAEINQLQQQAQALEVAVQGKAPTNHASQQPIFGTADEQMYGHVKIAHEVTNDSTDGVAVSPDGVYAYAPDRATTPRGICPTITITKEPDEWVAYFRAFATGNFVGVSGNYRKSDSGTRKITLHGVPAHSKLGVTSISADGLWTVGDQGSAITLTSNEPGNNTTTFIAIIPFIPSNV